ncbi:heparanase-like protein 1 isoform X2 [Ziziphus jujuba]|uniref:Heparanase-like protein 1 isoform X2 n=1 Tax=Ziziphus jujuba TaxID=326968 RepID=A0ABM3IJY8_ZIZJJ|nr:heparanase-like protein 1 isoform X2 [Ziziphus jujuba]
MEFCFSLFLLLISFPVILAQEDVVQANIVVVAATAVGEVDSKFICATIDWWPHDKCNYNQCPWGYTSAMNLNLSHPLLAKAIQAFKPLRIRIGGSLQDRVLYGVESLKAPCHPFQRRKDGLFGFSRGCLKMSRWDQLNQFFSTTGAVVTFGLNALSGRHRNNKGVWEGDWESTNAYDFIKYTISKGYQIDSWEFGNDPNLVSRILNPYHLNKIAGTFIDLEQTMKVHGPWASAWVGESGGAYNSGGRDVSNTFVDSFWYLDQLGMASKYNTKVYCRQTLIGGNYGLLDRTTFVPNPDYYSALLWHQLMGDGVLAVGSDASPYLRAYAHCSKGRAGITLLLINLRNQTEFIVNVKNSLNLAVHGNTIREQSSFMHGVKRTIAWVGQKASDGPLYREEYHLTPHNGYLRSKIMVLNGVPLEITEDGNIPKLNPVLVKENSLVSVSPHSIKFVVFPNFDAPGCA